MQFCKDTNTLKDMKNNFMPVSDIEINAKAK